MEEKLFEEFAGISRDEWQRKITTDLKGKAFESLNWESNGLSGGPVYTKEDLPESLPNVANAHEQPEIFGARHWVNYQLISVSDEKEANAKALQALNAGAEGLIFKIDRKPEFALLLKDISLVYCHVSWIDNSTEEVLDQYLTYLTTQQIDLQKINGFYQGNSRGQLSELPKDLKSIHITSSNMTAEQNPATELALLLSKAAQEFDKLTDEGHESERLFEQSQFELSMGSSYFIEIAKYRALRSLVVRFAAAYGLNLSPGDVNILAKSNDWTSELDDPHSHMLSATTQAMSAIIGGADAICLQPFYPVFPEQSSLAERAARNISSILKEESYLNKVIDPSAGTYFIESLTANIIDKGWELFLAIEANGGFSSVDANQVQSLNEKLL